MVFVPLFDRSLKPTGHLIHVEVKLMSIQRLVLVFFYAHRLWFPEKWLDWSVIHSGDSGGEEETKVVQVSSMVRSEHH